MKIVLNIAITITTLLFCIDLQAQKGTKFNNTGLSYQLHTGQILPHRTFFRPQISGFSLIHELSYIKQTDQHSQWARYFNFPQTGMTMAYINLSNSDILGNAVGILPFIQFLKRKNNFNYQFKVGVGFAYFTKTFDAITNYNNNAIGGHITNYSHFSFGIGKNINEKTNVNTALSLTHFSNGNTEQPNLGINILALKTGIIYHFNPQKIEYKAEKSAQFLAKKYIYHLNFGVGFSSIIANGGPNYPVWVGSIFVARKHNIRGAITLGTDFEKHNSIERWLVNLEHQYNNLFLAASKMSILGGYNFIFPHFSYHAQVGTYLFNPNVQKGAFVVRLNAFYHFKNQYKKQLFNPFIGLGLKSHYFSADFVQLMVGISL